MKQKTGFGRLARRNGGNAFGRSGCSDSDERPRHSGRRVADQDERVTRATQHEWLGQIGGKLLVAPIGYSAKLGVPFNLIERRGVFDQFRVCFHAKRKVVSFQTVD